MTALNTNSGNQGGYLVPTDTMSTLQQVDEEGKGLFDPPPIKVGSRVSTGREMGNVTAISGGRATIKLDSGKTVTVPVGKAMKKLTRYLVKTAKGYVTKDNSVYSDDDDEAKQFEDPADAQSKADEENKVPDGETPPEGEQQAQVEEVEVERPEETKEDETTPDEEPFAPKASAKHAAMLYQNAKDITNYVENALKEMDHPGMAEGLQKIHDKHVPIMQDELKALMHKFHGQKGEDGTDMDDPDGLMEKVVKAVESDGAGPTTETGEAELVDQGQLPPDSVSRDSDTEEINERYQDQKSKKWYTKTLGIRVRKGLNGKLYVLKDQSPAAQDGTLNLPSDQNANGEQQKGPLIAGEAIVDVIRRLFGGTSGKISVDGKPVGLTPMSIAAAIGSALKLGKSVGKDVALEQQDTSAQPYNKQVDDNDVEAVKDASDYMNEASEDDQVPKGHKFSMKSHGKRLGQVHKALTSAGKIQADGGRGQPLTDEGTSGNKGSMRDKGETQGKPPKGGEIIEGSGRTSYEGGTGDVTQLKDWEQDMIKSMESLHKEREETNKVARWIGVIPN